MLGDITNYEIRLCILVFLSSVTNTFTNLSSLVTLYTPSYHCDVGALPLNTTSSCSTNITSDDNGLEDFYLRFMIPQKENSKSLDECTQYNRTYQDFESHYLRDNSSCTTGDLISERFQCDNHVFDTSGGETSVTTEFQTVCLSSWQQKMALSALMAGKLLGGLVGGLFSDTFGRKTCWAIFTFVQFGFSVLQGFSSNFTMFAVLMFIGGTGDLVNYVSMWTLAAESSSKKYRTLACTCLTMGYSVGYMIFPLLQYYIRNWRWFVITVGATGVLYIPYLWLLDESPRWLKHHGKGKALEKVLKRIDTINGGKEFNKEEILALNDKENENKQSASTLRAWWKVLTCPVLVLRLAIMGLAWMMSSFVYYGIALGTNSLSGDRFLNCFFAGVAELISSIICLGALEGLGRKTTYILFMIIAGASVILKPLLQDVSTVGLIVSTMVGKVCVAITFNGCYLHTPELFPTSVRQSSLAVGSAFARVGGILVPFLIFSDNEWLTTVIITILNAVSVITYFFIPETKGIPLPKTVKEAKIMKGFSLPFADQCKSSSSDERKNSEDYATATA